MRFACVLIEHLPTQIEISLKPDLASRPIVVVRAWDERVSDATSDVIRAGIMPGDSRRRVEQLSPSPTTILIARESIYQERHSAIRTALLNYTEAVESGGLGEFFIEIGALARAFPSERELAAQVSRQVESEVHLQPKIGIASNKFTAQQAARQIDDTVSIVANGSERKFLEALTIAALPDPPAELIRRLHLFGITTLGGFADLPHAAVTAQFGKDLAFFHDLARGIDPRPLAPQAPPPIITRTLTLSDPLVDRQQMLKALEHVANSVARLLQDAGYHVLELSIELMTIKAELLSSGTSIKPPSSDVILLRRTVARLLGKLSPTSEVSNITVTAYPLREWHTGARQIEMFDATSHPKLMRWYEVLRTIYQRFGEAIMQLASVIGPPLPLPIKVHTRADGSPSVLQWGGWSRSVGQVYEYWREFKTWWDKPATREYYQIETPDGAIYILFRDEHGRWYLDRRRS